MNHGIWMSYGSVPPPPSGGGFRLEITRLGWVLMASYAGLWLLLYATTHWLPAGGWLPEVEFEQSVELLSVEVIEGGELSVRSLAKEDVVLRRGPQDPVRDSTGTPIVLRGGERVVIPAPPEGAPALSGWSTFGPGDLWQTLLLLPLGAAGTITFQPWQLITGPLFYPPQGGFPALMLSFLGFVFFAAPVERMLGRRTFLQLWLVASIGAVVFGLLLSSILPSPAFFGFAPAVFAVMVVHCMMTPEASVPFHLIFTVLHVRMKWIAAAIASLVVLRMLGLMGGGPSGAYSLAGLVCGYLWWRSGGDLNPRRMLLRRRARANLRVAVDRAIGGDDEPIFH